MMTERFRRNNTRVETEIEPVKIKIAFTGATYTRDGVTDKKLFCIVFVTFARNFDALNYIHEVFMCKPPSEDSKYARKRAVYEELQMGWKRMIRFVAFHNLGLDESVLGNPEQYEHDPSGILGVDSLLNMFQVSYHCMYLLFNSV